jgi:hypothetical protein
MDLVGAPSAEAAAPPPDHLVYDEVVSALDGLWVQDGACQSGVSPIFDRTKENLCSSDTGIAMTRRFILEALAAYRDHGTKPKGVSDPDVFMVRAVSLRLPPEDS